MPLKWRWYTNQRWFHLWATFAILDNSFDPNYRDDRNRPALAQTFQVSDAGNPSFGGAVTVVVNHFKSKGSGCGAGDDDTTTGQGNCNGTRTAAAEVMIDWLATDPDRYRDHTRRSQRQCAGDWRPKRLRDGRPRDGLYQQWLYGHD